MLDTPTRLGLVLDEREWTGDKRLADAPTAIILPDDIITAQALLDRVNEFRAHSVSPLLVVARPELVLRGRRLDQTVSRFAPYAEDQLLALAGCGPLA